MTDGRSGLVFSGLSGMSGRALFSGIRPSPRPGRPTRRRHTMQLRRHDRSIEQVFHLHEKSRLAVGQDFDCEAAQAPFFQNITGLVCLSPGHTGDPRSVQRVVRVVATCKDASVFAPRKSVG